MTRSIAGCGVLIYAGDVEIGAAVAASGSDIQVNDRVKTMGSIFARERVPVDRDSSMTLSVVRFKKGSIKHLGGMAQGDTLSILNFPPLTLVVYDRVSEKPVERLLQAVCGQRNWSIEANGIMSENVTFEGTRMLVEDEE